VIFFGRASEKDEI